MHLEITRMDAHLECELVGVEQLELALVDAQDGANRQVLLRVIAARVSLGARGRAAAGTRPAHLPTRGQPHFPAKGRLTWYRLQTQARQGDVATILTRRCMGGIMK